MRPILLTLSLLASLPTFPQTADSSQPEGIISGTVLDEHGDPFKGVTVCTYMIGAPSGSKEARGDCPVTTDQAGQFRIDHMAMGTFGVEAIKPEDGYIAFAGTSAKKKENGHLNTEPVVGDCCIEARPEAGRAAASEREG